MNIKIAIITGVILACASVPRAQNVSQNDPNLNDATLPAVPVMYERAESTNGTIFLVPIDQSFSASTEGSSSPDGTEYSPMGNAYPALFLSGEEPGVIQPAEGEAALLDNVTESELRYWLEESVNLTNEAAAGAGNSNFVQVIFIEPLDAPETDISDDMFIPEYAYEIVHTPPEWYAWLHPRMFISKWAELWTSGTYSTNVVLVLITF
jgi:hypothetical protein